MTAARRQGQPLAALGLLVAIWILARAAVWQAPLPLGQAFAMPDPAAPSARASGPAPNAGPPSAEHRVAPRAAFRPAAAPSQSGRADPRATFALGPPDAAARAAPPAGLLLPPAREPARDRLQRPSAVAPWPTDAPGRGDAGFTRWSGDGWLLWRGGAAAVLGTGAGTGRYGGSQAGAVLRYVLAPDGRRPMLYARTSAALGTLTERELALGAAVRPLAAVSVRAQIELRAVQTGGALRLRPAAFAVTELRPLELPARFSGEAYLQAGYVGGDFATPFVGGELRIDRPLANLGAARLRAGAGAWGGAQEGAAALDVGPGASIEMRLGEVSVRLAADYRLRVAGSARPRSGPALTLTTGF